MFQVVSFAVAALCVLKGAVALARPGRFYGWREGQYAASRPPLGLFAIPLALLALAAATYAVGRSSPVPFGWALTGFLALAGAGGLANLARWSGGRGATLTAVRAARTSGLRAVDLGILALGLAFLALGAFVY